MDMSGRMASLQFVLAQRTGLGNDMTIERLVQFAVLVLAIAFFAVALMK